MQAVTAFEMGKQSFLLGSRLWDNPISMSNAEQYEQWQEGWQIENENNGVTYEQEEVVS